MQIIISCGSVQEANLCASQIHVTNCNIFGWTIQIISAFVHMQTVQKELLAMPQMQECVLCKYILSYNHILILYRGVCIISLCTADMMCVDLFHPKQER